MDREEQTISSVAAYWNKRPCNVRHSPLAVGTAEYFNEVEHRKYFVEPHIPAFADFSRWTDKRVLELGCGIGTDAVNFARAGANYTGVDISQSSIDIAAQRFDVFGLYGRLLCGNIEALPDAVPPAPYDLVYAFGVLHHTPHPEVVIQHIRQHYMAPTSELRLMLYAANSWKAIMIGAGLDQPEAQWGCPIADLYTHDMIRTLLSEFDILDIRQTHIFQYDVERYIHYEYKKLPWFAHMPDRVLDAMEAALGWHTLITCKLQA